MKSLIIKDLYNIAHNAKSVLFILVMFIAVFIPTSGVLQYIVMCAMLCSMMIVTTFAFDDTCKWTPYAMIMPVSKKDLVTAKFVVSAIFCAAGSVFGLLAGFLGGLAMGKITLHPAKIGELLLFTLSAWAISFIIGSTSIPLVFRFGAEKGRVLLVASVLLPSAVCVGAYRLLVVLGVQVTEGLMVILLCISPVLACIWCGAMYRISWRIFLKQEF